MYNVLLLSTCLTCLCTKDKKDAASKKEKLSVICDDSNKTENNKTPVDKVPTEVNNENDSELKWKYKIINE